MPSIIVRVFRDESFAERGAEWHESIEIYERTERRSLSSRAWKVCWLQRFVARLETDMKRLRELEDESSRLKKIVADLSLDKEMLQDVLIGKL